MGFEGYMNIQLLSLSYSKGTSQTNRHSTSKDRNKK
jgi:hypothetical protein